MNKKTSSFLTDLLLATVALVVFGALICTIFWHEFINTGNLVFYKDEKIEKLVPGNERMYFITESGGYVAGGYHFTDDTRYMNVQRHKHKELKIPTPVKFFEGEIKEITPYRWRSAFFVTNTNVLYKLNDLEVTKISDSIAYAYESNSSDVYMIDINHVLYKHTDAGNERLLENVKAFKTYNSSAYEHDQSFALTVNDELYKVKYDKETEKYILDELLLSNVKSFDVKDISYEFRGSAPEDAYNKPIINALTNNGELYVKGIYNSRYCGYGGDSPNYYITYDSWTLIGEKVSSFSLSEFGTGILFENEKCAYFGYEICGPSNELRTFNRIEFAVNNAYDVFVTSNNLSIFGKDGYCYFYGVSFDNIFMLEHFQENEEISKFPIFEGSPYVVKMK